MRKNAYILLAALGLASCNYLEIEPVGKVIPHKTSEYRALLTEGYSRFPYTSSKAYTGLLSDEVGMFHEGNFFDSSDAIALSYNYTWQYETQSWEYPTNIITAPPSRQCRDRRRGRTRTTTPRKTSGRFSAKPMPCALTHTSIW